MGGVQTFLFTDAVASGEPWERLPRVGSNTTDSIEDATRNHRTRNEERRKEAHLRGVRATKLSLSTSDLFVAETVHQMVVHDAGGLHQRIADRRPHEAKTALAEVLAQRLGKRRFGRK